MSRNSLLISSLAVILSAQFTSCYNILGIFPVESRSHYITGGALMKGLAAAGHNVTVISPYPQAKPLPNYRDITISGVMKALQESTDFENLASLNSLNVLQTTLIFLRLSQFTTNFTLQHPVMREFLSRTDEHFDVVICELMLGDSYLGLGQHFDAPVIAYTPFGANLWTTEVVGSPTPLSYVPNVFLQLTNRMTFAERVANVAFTAFEYATYPAYLRAQELVYNEAFAADVHRPPFDAVRRNVSLVLLNQHFALNYPRPYVPNMIEVGGIHINRQAARELPADIGAFVDGAEHGVIYFSMGSNVQSSDIPPALRDGLLRVFAGLRERVLWRWDEELPGGPANVLVRRWFPQDDVLAHPQVKLFITHGGLLSTTEAMYHGVPVVGVPMFFDQFSNMVHAVNRGYGVTIAFSNLTETSLRWGLEEVLGDERYSVNAQTISRRFRDQPMDPLQTGVYWVEYVVRHGGAPHLRSAGLDLTWWQYHSVDVFAFLAVVVAVVLYLVWLIVAYAVRKIVRHIGCNRDGKIKKQ